MLTVARITSALTVLLTVAAIDTWRVHVIPWGFESTLYIAGITFHLAVLMAVVSLVIVGMRMCSGSRTGLAQVAVPSVLSLASLGTLHVIGPK